MSTLKKISVLCILCCTICTSAWAQLNTDRLIAIGRNALYFDDYVLSIQYFNQVIRLKPYLHEPYQLRAIAKIQLGDLNGALIDCNRAIELNPFQPGAFYTRGYVYRGLKNYNAAEADFTQALVFSPENKTYLLLRADVRAQNEQYDEAITDIDYLLRREPQSPSLLFERGVISLSRKDTLSALEAFTATTHYDSQNSGNWSALGVTEMMIGHDEEALTALDKAITLGSQWAGDYINRGTLYYRKHNFRNALNDYGEAIKIEPNSAQGYYYRGVLRHELGDYNHALEDLNHAIDIEPDKTEMYYQRATTLMQLKQWADAIEDLETLIARYPYFLPSYYLAAQAKTAQGDTKKAYQYRKTAYDLEQKKDSINTAKNLNTDLQIAQSQNRQRDRRKEFSSRIAQNQSSDMEDENNTYSSQTRGSIQKKYVDVINEPNIALSYFAKNESLRRTNYFHYFIANINKAHYLPSPLYFTTQEIPLTADLVGQHFDRIGQLSAQIDNLTKSAIDLTAIRSALFPLYWARAMEFSIVQDYISAMDDATRAINTTDDIHAEVIITFSRANWRYKQLQYQRATGELTKESAMDFDIMLRDYDYVSQHCPDFAFAYYNKANMLCSQQEYESAIQHYTKAIAVDQDFAEAYFNRGLTYIYINNTEAGIEDLSKAGELGIYQAYNLITRFR